MILRGLPSIALMVIFYYYMLTLEFLGKSATDPKYCLLFVDLFTSKVYVYPTKMRKSIANKMEIFYKEIDAKRKGQNKASNGSGI